MLGSVTPSQGAADKISASASKCTRKLGEVNCSEAAAGGLHLVAVVESRKSKSKSKSLMRRSCAFLR